MQSIDRSLLEPIHGVKCQVRSLYLHLVAVINAGVVVKQYLHDHGVSLSGSQHQCRSVLIISASQTHGHYGIPQ